VKKKEPPDMPWAQSPFYSMGSEGSSFSVFGDRVQRW